MIRFDEKIILVTGGATGLGAAITLGCAKAGAAVVIICYRNSRSEAESVAAAARLAGAEAIVLQGDVSDDGDCRRIAKAASKYGRLDILVNSAGMTKHLKDHRDLDGLAKEDFLLIYAVNTVGPFQMVRACQGLLLAAASPSVLMISSLAAVTGQGSSVAYAASKGALNTMTISLARA